MNLIHETSKEVLNKQEKPINLNFLEIHIEKDKEKDIEKDIEKNQYENKKNSKKLLTSSNNIKNTKSYYSNNSLKNQIKIIKKDIRSFSTDKHFEIKDQNITDNNNVPKKHKNNFIESTFEIENKISNLRSKSKLETINNTIYNIYYNDEIKKNKRKKKLKFKKKFLDVVEIESFKAFNRIISFTDLEYISNKKYNNKCICDELCKIF